MANPRGFDRGLPNQSRRQRIIQNSTTRANQALARAKANGYGDKSSPSRPPAFPTTSAGVMAEGNRGGRALSDARLGNLTTKLQTARAAGDTARVTSLRSTLQGRRAPSIGATRGSTALSPQKVQSLTERLKSLRTERRGLPAPAIGDVTPGTPTRQDQIYKSIRQIRGKLGGQRNTPMPLPTPPAGGVRPPGEPTGPLPPGTLPPPPQGPGQGTPPGVVPKPRGIKARVGPAGGYRGRPIGR